MRTCSSYWLPSVFYFAASLFRHFDIQQLASSTDTFILIVCGIITGGMMQSKLSSFNFHILPIVSTLSVVLLGVLSAVSATSIFDKAFVFRERSSNLYVFPYFISRIFLDMAIILVKGFVFGTILCCGRPFNGIEVIILFVIVAYASTPVGYISSIIITISLLP